MSQPNEKAATSLRLDAPGLGLDLDQEEIDEYLELARRGVIIPETACDKGMQDNFALRTDTTVELRPATT